MYGTGTNECEIYWTTLRIIKMSTYHDKKYTIQFPVNMTAEQHKLLMKRAKKLGISASEFIRRMIMLD